MSTVLQNSFSNLTHRIKLSFPNTTHFNPTKTPNFPIIHHNPFQSIQFNRHPIHKNLFLFHNHHFHTKSNNSTFNFNEELEKNPSKSSTFDDFLSWVESFCVISSMVVSVGCVLNWVYFKQHNSWLVLFGNKVLVLFLAGSVAVGSVIRRRQWRRVCGSDLSSKPGFESGNLIERVEKLEESMKSVSRIIRMLSRQLEKLGIRFRVTRKAIKDPIAETVALVQKNSEATRALAVQEDNLEKELAEVQKVLLAMQDQQQKQLELLLAIAKRGKLLENKPDPNQAPGRNKKDLNHSPTQVDKHPIQAVTAQKDSTNNIVGSSS